MIAFYYGLSGFACAVYYRKEIMREGTATRVAAAAGLGGTAVLVLATLLPSNALAFVAAGFLVAALVFGLAAAKDIKALPLVGALPAIGGVILTYVFFKSCKDYSHPANSESGDSWLGLGPPLVIGLGFMLIGVILMLFWARGNPDSSAPRRRRSGQPPSRHRSRRAAEGGAMANEIVVGYDGTEGARAALRCAVELGKDLNAPLVLVFGYGLQRTSAELRAQLDAVRELGESATKAGLEEARVRAWRSRPSLWTPSRPRPSRR